MPTLIDWISLLGRGCLLGLASGMIFLVVWFLVFFYAFYFKSVKVHVRCTWYLFNKVEANFVILHHPQVEW